jgi:RNA 2',3'-cyclic 3'-phosphodiesterase
MRAFLGVPMPAFETLARLVAELRASGADLKVVDARQFHLTIKFMGEVRPELVEAVLAAMRAGPLPAPFDLAVKDVGAFPNWKKLNVAWAGVEDPAGGLGRLFEAAERAWVGLGGASEERPFSAHLTLARKRTDRGVAEARAVLNEYRGLAFGTAHVDRVNLYRSTLTPEGPRYDVVGEVAL